MSTDNKIAFVVAATAHGSMLVNRYDFHNTPEGVFGVGIELLECGSFASAEIDLCCALLDSRRKYYDGELVAIDCGANIGTHTIPLARHMRGWGSVVAIEAQERVFYALCGNICMNNVFNARAINAVVWGCAGGVIVPQLDFQHPASFGSLELCREPIARVPEDIGQDIDKCPIRAMPAVSIDSLSLRADLIKIDVEGMEADVLAGAVNTVKTAHPVFMVEWTKSSKEQLLAIFAAWDYKVLERGNMLLAMWRSDPVLG